MIKQKLTKLQQDIFRMLCLYSGEELNQSDIAGKLNVSSAAVSKSVSGLEEEKLITVDRSSKIKLHLIKLDRDNPRAIELKRIENLRITYESGMLDYLEGCFPGKTIILFGSYSRGEDTVKSDIDIAIIGKDSKVSLEKFEKILNRNINIQFIPSLKSINKELLSGICNGIVLTGAIEL